jgi:hypothetical protein
VDIIPLIVLTLASIWSAWQFFWGAPLGSRRYFRQSSMREPLTYEWNEDGLRIHNERMSNRLRWDEFLRWAESPDSIVLIMTERTYMPIAKRFFSAADLAELRSQLKVVRRVGPKGAANTRPSSP